MHEGIPILPCHVPKAVVHDNGVLKGMSFEIVEVGLRRQGPRTLKPTGAPDVFIECDEVLVAIGQENAFPWIERDCGIDFDPWGLPVLDADDASQLAPAGLLRRRRRVRAQEHHHRGGARPRGGDLDRPPAAGARTWRSGRRRTSRCCRRRWASTSGATTTRSANDLRHKTRWTKAEEALESIKIEAELGFDAATAFKETQRCLNCDVQTVFADKLCIECDACVDICPMDCISFIETGRRGRPAHAAEGAGAQRDAGPVRSGPLKTARVMVKDEDVCLHCGLCAERCPTGAWDMQKFLVKMAHAGPAHRDQRSRRSSWRHRPSETPRSPQRLRRQVRQRQRLGLGQRERAVRQGDPAHGRAGEPAQHLPEQHPGPADLVRGARVRARLARPARRHRHDGGDEPADLGRRRARGRVRRLPVLRQHQAAARERVPQRRQQHRHADDGDLQRHLQRSAAAPAVQEHPVRRRAGAADGHRAGGHREAVRRAVQGQGEAARLERAGVAPGRGLRARAPGAAAGGPAGAAARPRGPAASSSTAMRRPRSAASTAARRCARGTRSRPARRWPRPSPATARSCATIR